MRTERNMVVVSVALALLVALPLAAAAGEPAARRVADESDLPIGWSAEGQVGDFILTNGEASFIIENVGHPHGDGLAGGNIIDASVAPFWEDAFGGQLTLLVSYPRQAVYDTVFIDSEGGSVPASIVARGHDSENQDIEVETRYVLAADDRFVMIETVLTNHGASVSGYAAGDALNWGDGVPFVPYWGFDVPAAPSATYTDWIGAAASGPCYGYTQLSATSITTRHTESRSDPILYAGGFAAGGSVSFTRHFVVGGLGLASVSNVIHELRGEPTGAVYGTVRDAESGEPLAGASVTCRVGTAIHTRARTDSSGNYSATLVPGNYSFKATRPNYLEDEKPGSVSLSQVTTVDFGLNAGSWTPEKGDTLTVVMRPILSVPTIVTPGGTFTIEAVAPNTTEGWEAVLRHGNLLVPLSIDGATWDYGRRRWFITARVPSHTTAELYDMVVTADGGIEDEVRHCVDVKKTIDDDFYFIQITDTHLPTHEFYYEEGADSDTSEMTDLHEVIKDINLINPAFVVHTGDVVNEGELEDFLNWRAFTRSKRILRELEVPVFVVAGNHDVGGWESTPVPDGTARRTWWRFFGWRSLYSPPPAEPVYTQNYSFDYGGAHFVGMEAYDNYDNWRHEVYGRTSFTNRQMAWLTDDLSLVEPSTPVVAFYHYDFGHELDLSAYGIDCGLWGHIHVDSGSITEQPYDLATRAVCDRGRAMRLVRVHDGQIVPSETIRAGRNGENLRMSYSAPNDGTQASLTATLLNAYPETFEHGLVRFQVRADSIPYKVDNGEVAQTVIDGDVATVYVNVQIAAEAATYVTIEPNTSYVPGGHIAALKQSRPNPANISTTIHFVLASPTRVSLDVYDVSGRRVASLADGPMDEGPQERTWDLTDDGGNRVASGVYFCRLEAADETFTEKLVVLK